MKLATYCANDSTTRLGSVHTDNTRVLDLQAAAKRAGLKDVDQFASMLALIDAGGAGLAEASELLARYIDDRDLSSNLSDVRLMAPLQQPRQMRDGMSFETHIRQSSRGIQRLALGDDEAAIAELEAQPLPPLADIYRMLPIYYITNRMIVAGPDDTIVWPRYSKIMDYELEFGVVIGRSGKNISAADARDHIFGYTIFNDFSARDQQAREMAGRLGPAKGKSFDGANVLGPWLVTKDELTDPYDLKAFVRVNGELRCASTTAGMLFTFEEILAHMSQDETVYAGEFIGSGTIGNGCGLETGLFLKDGDVVELEIEGIGILRNKVVRNR
ncbi:fumarylacetoacetate hydrolase family protein [Rhizobium sp. P38BS-XIX]|uniref:fumarylacetoacetate hydrolase family protein n=1 Tax=Rhizobium sp. P38BS-XIX TaxID=2726740 RepID=UPI00145789D7|nr:fumarylacetoacetate hydrolase family protein [Rhizobium sp. P38BS-XIX]NLS01269.1 fumarylacetoacetate hydrolase family protein [Rhizobium sp. P38BS-XIX]